MNQDDKNYITDTVGKEAIKYLESPFGMNMSNITIDGQEMDLSQTMPSYAQVVSLYEDTSISVSSNETDKVLAGYLYTDTNEQGLTIPISLLKNWNEQTGKNLTAADLIGKPVSASIVENAAEASKIAQFQTKIVRVINDEDDIGGQQQFHVGSSNGNDFERSWIYKSCILFYLGTQRSITDKSGNRRTTEK